MESLSNVNGASSSLAELLLDDVEKLGPFGPKDR